MIKHLFRLVLWLLIGLPAAMAETVENTTPTDPLSIGNMLNMLFGLVFVIAMIFALAWIVKRMGGIQLQNNQRLRLLGGLSLGARERVVLVQVDNKKLVLGVAPGHVRTLHVMEGEIEEPINSAAGPDNHFKDKLLQALKSRSGL